MALTGAEFATLKSFATSLAKAASPIARRLYREHKAGKNPLTNRDDLLENELDKTLNRLLGSRFDETWWNRLLGHVGHHIVTPEFLQKQSLQTWLADPLVQSNLKALARARIIGSERNQDELVRLRRAYEEKTLEDGRYAQGPIDVVVAVLVAGYAASLGSATPLAGLIQAGISEARESFEQLGQQIGAIAKPVQSDPLVVAVHTRIALQQLEQLLRLRSLEPDQTIDRARLLVQRVFEGDLLHAEPTVRSAVLYWAARLHSSERDLLPTAKEHLARLQKEEPTFDTRIVEALIFATEGDADAALRLLRDVNSPDGRSVLLVVLSRHQDEQTAIQWYDEQDNRAGASLLTGPGWSNLSIMLAQAGRWEEAASILASAEEHVAEWPDLLFVEGVINAALLLPQEHRTRALQMQLFHPAIQTTREIDSEQRRARAYQSFEKASQALAEIGAHDRAHAAKDWVLWLRLTESSTEIIKAAQEEVGEGMKDGCRAVDLLPFAIRFSIPFDSTVIERYLAQRARLGGLVGREVFAELMLAERTMSPEGYGEFLERNEIRLAKAGVPVAALVGKRIEALVRDGQPSRAKRLLEERKGELVGGDCERLRAMVLAKEGEDPLPILEELYRQTHSLFDLENLIEHLWTVRDWTSLHPLLDKLFSVERTPDNARRLLDCLRHLPSGNDAKILKFFEDNADVADWSPDLASAKAWALFHVGRLKEARAINDGLRTLRAKPIDVQLDVNLAIQSGEWERFPIIIENEWPRRNEYDADTLLRLASLAAQTDTTEDRAYELATLAVSKGEDNARVLANAYALAVQLGREGEAEAKWIVRAAELSSEDGPVWKVEARTLVEHLTPHRERVRVVEKSLMRGEIPLHVAASALTIPLARLLFDIPRRNSEQTDGRRRTPVPVISGVHQSISIRAEWKVGLDATSLMVLSYLGLLRPTLQNFGKVVLASDTMSVLLEESRRVQFHQPSRVKHAEEIRELIDQGRLHAATTVPEPPQWLIDNVGQELAQLLDAAHTSNTLVVRSLPIFQSGSFLEKEAKLGDYSGTIISTSAFARLLYESGRIDHETYEHASRYLAVHDSGPKEEIHRGIEVLNHPLYLDDVAVTHLQYAGLIPSICHQALDLRIHPSLRAEQDAIIGANREGERIANYLDDIRCALRDLLATEKAILLPWNDPGRDNDRLATLSQFLASTGPCDALCVDDRYINRNTVLKDQTGRTIPIVCITDVLRYLEGEAAISTGERWAAMYRLRKSAFALVPVEADELSALLKSVRLNRDGRIIESAELKAIRQVLMLYRSLDLIDIQLEEPFLSRLRLVGLQTIRMMWQDDALTDALATSLSTWIWDNFIPVPMDWSKSIREAADLALAQSVLAHHLRFILMQAFTIGSQRRMAFLNWLEQKILAPLLPANSNLVDEAAEQVRLEIERWTEERGHV